MPDVSAGRPEGALAIVLHTHMPYVEGFGTWPFGEEWLWEAIATCYMPLLDLLDRGAPLTLSLTPVLCDQLEAPGIAERFVAFVEEVRRPTHEEDARGLRAAGHDDLARELTRSLGDYERAAARLIGERDGDLLAALAPHAQWTSAATHAVLPLLATEACVRAQARTGIDSHRARFGDGWKGGFWLPECAHAPGLEKSLLEAGAKACCVELTGRFGLGDRRHLQPLLSDAGLILLPIDRETISLVWSDAGYPADGRYRDYHRHTVHHHNPWSNAGGPYSHEQALEAAAEHAADFVARTARRLREASEERAPAGALPGGGLAICALDTELLGHWWYEGLAWLEAVVEECSRQGLALIRLDDALQTREPRPLREAAGAAAQAWEWTSWGRGGDLSTWSGPAVADIAFAQRDAELRAIAARERVGPAAVRELMAMQSSDWAFMVSRELAGPYPRERFHAHRERFAAALAAGPAAPADALRNLAVHADPSVLMAP